MNPTTRPKTIQAMMEEIIGKPEGEWEVGNGEGGRQRGASDREPQLSKFHSGGGRGLRPEGLDNRPSSPAAN